MAVRTDALQGKDRCSLRRKTEKVVTGLLTIAVAALAWHTFDQFLNKQPVPPPAKARTAPNMKWNGDPSSLNSYEIARYTTSAGNTCVLLPDFTFPDGDTFSDGRLIVKARNQEIDSIEGGESDELDAALKAACIDWERRMKLR